MCHQVIIVDPFLSIKNALEELGCIDDNFLIRCNKSTKKDYNFGEKIRRHGVSYVLEHGYIQDGYIQVLIRTSKLRLEYTFKYNFE